MSSDRGADSWDEVDSVQTGSARAQATANVHEAPAPENPPVPDEVPPAEVKPRSCPPEDVDLEALRKMLCKTLVGCIECIDGVLQQGRSFLGALRHRLED